MIETISFSHHTTLPEKKQTSYDTQRDKLESNLRKSITKLIDLEAKSNGNDELWRIKWAVKERIFRITNEIYMKHN